MNTHITRRIGRYMALLIVAAGTIGGVALDFAGSASAAEGTWSYDPQPRSGIVAVPQTKANPPALSGSPDGEAVSLRRSTTTW